MTKRVAFLLITLITAVFFGARAEAEDWKASLSATYETGKYGTDTSVDTLYIPFTIKRYFDLGDISLTVPFISQTSTGQVTVVNGMVFRTGGAKKATVTTESGIGDIIGKGSLYVLQESRNQLLDVSVVGKIKFPTADKDKGLGTGEYDETVGLELDKVLVPDWTGFFDIYYTFIGKPAGLSLKDATSFDIGVSDKIQPDLTASIFYSESTPIVSGVPDLRDLLANVEYKFSKEASLFGGVDVGLSSSSPAIGITGGFSYRF